MPIDVAVVGSINHDLTVLTTHHPQPGETVLGRGHRSGAGGKGANQAVAASRVGSTTALIARVGDDEHGRSLLASLQSDGVDDGCVGVDGALPTGLAVITVDDSAENSIVVSPGANMALEPGHVAGCADILSGAQVVLAQLEIPVETVMAAAEASTGVFCLNPAPAKPLPVDLLRQVDVLVPNRSELAALSSTTPPSDLDEVVVAVAAIDGPGAVIVTLGGDGAVVIERGEVTPIPAPRVEAVDTTGAGDAFCGALASALSRGRSLVEAAHWATIAGALATTRAGAQASMPTRAEVEEFLSG